MRKGFLVAIMLGAAGGSWAACPQLKGNYATRGGDADIFFHIEQTACKQITIQEQRNFGSRESSEKLIVTLDGVPRPVKGHLGSTEECRVAGRFEGSRLHLIFRCPGDRVSHELYALDKKKNLRLIETPMPLRGTPTDKNGLLAYHEP